MLLTLFSSGLKSMSNVSSTTLTVSTSSASLAKLPISPRRDPDATEAGNCFAKLLSPSIAARRSSSKVALRRRLLSVLIVSVAVCLAGVWPWRMPNIVARDSHNQRVISHRYIVVVIWTLLDGVSR